MMIFKELTTGAGNDIEQATGIARKMVCEWGMSEDLGPMTFGKKNEEIFLGREIQSHRDYSETTAKLIDDEVVKIIRKAEKSADSLLRKMRKLYTQWQTHCLSMKRLIIMMFKNLLMVRLYVEEK